MDPTLLETQAVEQPSLKELYEIAIRTREHELNLFWQRSNYFLALDSGAVALFFSIKAPVPWWTLPVCALFGVGISFFWLELILGGKYWQIRWEAVAERLEKQCAPDAKLFAASPDEIRGEVRALMNKYASTSRMSRLMDRLVMRKPSPSKSMMGLSLLFIGLWVFLLVASFFMDIRGATGQ
jgi:hypothetical protein